MKQEEFYIWLLSFNSKARLGKLPDFNPEFLKNYEIAKLLLDKFGIRWLNENQQRILNSESISSWFRTSRNIKLNYDIPEILDLLPERIIGNLNLRGSKIQILPELISVRGFLDLGNSQVQSLPKLESVGRYLDLWNSQIQLPKLEYVGGTIYASSMYWRDYFKETGRSDLAKKAS